MKIDAMKQYSMSLMGRSCSAIDELISKKWEAHDFVDQAYEQIETLGSPDKEVYQFILGVSLGNWNHCSKAIEVIETKSSQNLNKYQQIALMRMKAMVHIAKGESIEAVKILESAYREIPSTYAWLKRTLAVDIRNVTLQHFWSENQWLIEKGKKWQNILLKLPNFYPLLDRNDSDSLNIVLGEFFEAGTKFESTVRFSNSIREALESQFKNFILSARLGYYTGTNAAKRNIGLILYQWASIHDDSFLYSMSLYEFIENGNESEVQKFFSKHSDILVGNRASAVLLFDKMNSLSNIPLLQGIKLIIAERIYDFLKDDDCEVIDQFLINSLKQEGKDHHRLAMKRLAMKAFIPQSRRVAPVWFLEFAEKKLKKNDEHWWFYLDLFKTLGSIDVSNCDKQTIAVLVKGVLNYFHLNQTFEDMHGIQVLHNLTQHLTEGHALVKTFLIEKYGSKESAFKKHPLYFTTLDHSELLDAYQEYIQSAIREFKDGTKLVDRPKSISMGDYVVSAVLWNIVKKHSSQLNKTNVFHELADASLNYCLNPHVEATKKRSVLRLIKVLIEKADTFEYFNAKLRTVRDTFNDFSTAIDDSLGSGGYTTLGALAGSTYLKMGGDLSPSLWNHIWRDKGASYNNRIDFVEAMAEIAGQNTPYSMLCFYALSELVHDKFFPVSSKALVEIADLNEFPESITPMLCQSIFKASHSGNVGIRIRATYSIKKIYKKIENQYWHNQLETRLKELEEDDCRPVRRQVAMMA